MAWTREQLIAWVQGRIDEVGPPEQLAVASPTLIAQELDEAARLVLLAAPKAFVYPAGSRHVSDCFVTVQGSTNCSVIIPLPSDYLRFLRVKLDNWTDTADVIVEAGSISHKAQVNPYTRATVNRPVVAIVPLQHSTYTRALECWPAPEKFTSYQRIMDPEKGSEPPAGTALVQNSGLIGGKRAMVQDCIIIKHLAAEQIPTELVDALVWLTASRTLASLRVYDGEKAAFNEFQASLTLATGGTK